MSLKSTFAREIITDAIKKDLSRIMDREIAHIPTDVPKIISILGPRRAGKTSVCLQLIKSLRNTIPSDRLLYVNFEDDRFYPAKLEDMDLLLRSYYELYPENKSEKVYFFFDEVQEITGWEKFVRRVFDTENCQLFITGSSSKLLSKEIATSLRGRTLSYEIFPLSFTEFLSFQGLSYDENSSEGSAFLKKRLTQYLWQGGFPELIFLPESLHIPTINEYINLMLYKDLTERFNVKNTQLLKYLLKYSLTNMANPLSINKVFNDLKSQGYAVSKNTVYDYLSYLEEAFILYKASRWSTSIRQTAINPIKLYGVDQAFKYAMTGKSDHGRIMENIVYMALRRLGYEPQYALFDQEVDFYFNDRSLLNVCSDLEDNETRKRELNGISKAMRNLSLKKALLICWDDEYEEKAEDGIIYFIPLYKFLLNPKKYVD